MSDTATTAVPWEGRPYSIKRHGVSITNCDSEPVQTPGCIQGHGALLVVRPDDLTILQASENAERWLGRSAQALLGHPVTVAIGDPGAAQLRQILRSASTEHNPLYVFTLEGRGDIPPLDVTVHATDGVAVVELEATGRGGAPEADYYRLVKTSVGRLQTTRTLREFCQTVSEEVQALTGFDRVMVYRFHEDKHGEVFAEARRPDLAPWLGLHYPADDIPKPARDIFRQIWIRPVPEIGAELAELVPLANPDTGKGLSMTYCVLRGPSIMYTEYLQNMGVTAALTLAIRRGGELWGLIAAHHYSGPAHIPYEVRAACELFAQVVSLQHQAAEDREHLLYRLKLDGVHQQLVAAAAQEGDLAAMIKGAPTLLDAIDAGGVALYHRDRWWCAGKTPSEAELQALSEWLHGRRELESTTRPAYATDALVRAYPPAEAFAGVASGLLAVRLSRVHKSILLWFRPEMIQTVSWGGDPHDKPTVPGPHGPRLSPRKSFELFVESVRLRSLPWRHVEIDAACRLRFLAMELVLGQAERLAELNADLVRSNEELDAFAYVASHDLKEPLRGIHQYAHQLLHDAGVVSDAQRGKLDGLMRLTVRMDSLLDSLLHFSRVGRTSLELEEVDLTELLAEAIEMVDVRRTEKPTDIVIPRPMPRARCDRVRVREIFVNLLSNAMKYSDKPRRWVEVGFVAPSEAGARGDAPAAAAEQVIYYVRDDGIGILPSHHAQVFKLFKRLHGHDEHGGGAGAGLTIVKRVIERHGGHIWLESIPGQGSTFFFTLGQGKEAQK